MATGHWMPLEFREVDERLTNSSLRPSGSKIENNEDGSRLMGLRPTLLQYSEVSGFLGKSAEILRKDAISNLILKLKVGLTWSPP